MRSKSSHPLLRITEKTIKQHQLFGADDLLLVALSGGADSVALLLLLKEMGYRTEALHCNFHLRGEESDRDERFVHHLCNEHDIKLHTKHFDTSIYAKSEKISIEMAARNLRYAWFEEMLIVRQAHCVCVAHHLQDQAETLLLNLLRGSGIRGLAGMHYQNGNIVRPLLDAPKSDIYDYLHIRQQTWVEDSTNQERDAQRNCIRLDIIPMLKSINPKAVEHLAQTAGDIQQALPYYEKGVQSTTSRIEEHYYQKPKSTGENNQNTNKNLREQHLPIDAAFLHEHLRGCGFTRTQEKNIMTAKTGSIIESATHRLLRDRTEMVLQDKRIPLHLPIIETRTMVRNEVQEMQDNCMYFDNQLVKHPISIRLVRTGDRMTLFGMKGTKLVSDIFINLKLNLFEKERQQVVVDADDNILCILGLRRSNLCRITDNTTELLIIKQSCS